MDLKELIEDLKSEGLTDEDLAEVKVSKPDHHSFPFLMLVLAIFKDITDWVDAGTVLGFLANFIVGPIMFIYMWGKIGYIKRWMYRKYIFTMIIEFIPFINLIPQNTFFIVRAHLKEHEQVDKILDYVEKLLAKDSLKKA